MSGARDGCPYHHTAWLVFVGGGGTRAESAPTCTPHPHYLLLEYCLHTYVHSFIPSFCSIFDYEFLPDVQLLVISCTFLIRSRCYLLLACKGRTRYLLSHFTVTWQQRTNKTAYNNVLKLCFFSKQAVFISAQLHIINFIHCYLFVVCADLYWRRFASDIFCYQEPTLLFPHIEKGNLCMQWEPLPTFIRKRSHFFGIGYYGKTPPS